MSEGPILNNLQGFGVELSTFILTLSRFFVNNECSFLFFFVPFNWLALCRYITAPDVSQCAKTLCEFGSPNADEIDPLFLSTIRLMQKFTEYYRN